MRIPMTTVQADFVEDLRRHAEQELCALGHKVAPRDPSDPNLCIFRLAGVLRRRIEPRPRQVLWSLELQAKSKTLAPPVLTALARVVALSEAGADLSAHASDKRNETNFQDDLINDWNIHHLHLGAEGQSGTVKRKDRLLFAMVGSDVLYFLDVRNHRSFGDVELIDIVHRNWPNVLRRYHAAILAVSPAYRDPLEIKALRNARVTACVTLEDGTVLFPPGGGINTAGSAVQDVTTAHAWLRHARDAEAWGRANAEQFADRVLRVTGGRPAVLHLRLSYGPDGPTIIESKHAIALAHGPDSA